MDQISLVLTIVFGLFSVIGAILAAGPAIDFFRALILLLKKPSLDNVINLLGMQGIEIEPNIRKEAIKGKRNVIWCLGVSQHVSLVHISYLLFVRQLQMLGWKPIVIIMDFHRHAYGRAYVSDNDIIWSEEKALIQAEQLKRNVKKIIPGAKIISEHKIMNKLGILYHQELCYLSRSIEISQVIDQIEAECGNRKASLADCTYLLFDALITRLLSIQLRLSKVLVLVWNHRKQFFSQFINSGFQIAPNTNIMYMPSIGGNISKSEGVTISALIPNTGDTSSEIRNKLLQLYKKDRSAWAELFLDCCLRWSYIYNNHKELNQHYSFETICNDLSKRYPNPKRLNFIEHLNELSQKDKQLFYYSIDLINSIIEAFNSRK